MPFSSPDDDDDEPFKGQAMTMWQLSFPLSSLGKEKLPTDRQGLKALAIRLVGKWHAPIPGVFVFVFLTVNMAHTPFFVCVRVCVCIC